MKKKLSMDASSLLHSCDYITYRWTPRLFFAEFIEREIPPLLRELRAKQHGIQGFGMLQHADVVE